MIAVVCVDDRGGMTFNHRRVSRDKGLIADLLALRGEAALYIHPYSLPLFGGAEKVIASEDFLDLAGEGDVCFVENVPLTDAQERIERLIVYRWNRDYPADTYLDVDLEAFRLEASTDFAGSSHDPITREEYTR